MNREMFYDIKLRPCAHDSNSLEPSFDDLPKTENLGLLKQAVAVPQERCQLRGAKLSR